MYKIKESNRPVVLVAGRGVMGLWAALRLQQSGSQVWLIGPDEGQGAASFAAVGVSSVRGLVVARDPLFQMKLQGHKNMPRLIRELEKLSGNKIPHYFSGALELYTETRHYAKLRERVYHGEFTGCFRFQRLGRAELMKRSQFLTRHFSSETYFSGALHYPGDGWYDPQSYLNAIEKSFLKLGGIILPGYLRDVSEIASGQLRVSLDIRGNVISEKQSFQSDRQHEIIDDLVLAIGSGTGPAVKQWCGYHMNLHLIGGVTMHSRSEYFCQQNTEIFRFGRYGFITGMDGMRYGSEDFNPEEKHEFEISRDQAVVKLKTELFNKMKINLNRYEKTLKISDGVRVRSHNRQPFLIEKSLINSKKRIWIAGGLFKSGFDIAPIFADKIVRSLSLKCSKYI